MDDSCITGPWRARYYAGLSQHRLAAWHLATGLVVFLAETKIFPAYAN